MAFVRTSSRYFARWMGMPVLGSNCKSPATTDWQRLHKSNVMTRRGFHDAGKRVVMGTSILHPTKQRNCLMFAQRQETTMTTPPAIAELDNAGKTCKVTWDDGYTASFHSVWLRHNCHCALCRHANGQRVVDPVSIPHDIKLDTVNVKDGNMTLTWTGANEQGHVGEITLGYLRENNYSDATLASIREAVRLDKPAKEIPTISYEDIKDSDEGRFRWLKQINDAGVSIVNGVPLELGMVEKVGEWIAPVWEYFYGTISDLEAIPDPINLAFSNVQLDYHMDLVYFESPPGLLLLHCIKFDENVKGGDSTFLDVHTYAEEFRTQHPEHFHTLTTVPATFHKIHYDRDFPVHLVNQKPHIKLNHNGDIVAVYWSPPFEGPLSVKGDDVERYYAAYEAFARGMVESPHQLQYRMVPGDLIVVNNIRVLHGRTTFDASLGERHIQTVYINIDFFKNKMQTMSKLFGDGSLPKRVGNQCWR